VGEADVLLLMTDGELVPGEVKRHGAGLTQQELNKLDVISGRLNSPWNFIATPDWAAICPPLWREAIRSLPQPPRFCLTGEHLFERFPMWGGLDSNPFEPRLMDGRRASEEYFRTWVVEELAWLGEPGDAD
jgi:hypothetical protein